MVTQSSGPHAKPVLSKVLALLRADSPTFDEVCHPRCTRHATAMVKNDVGRRRCPSRVNSVGVVLQGSASRRTQAALMTPVSSRGIPPQAVHVMPVHAILAPT